jgi:DNA-binding beta-propeller fold protein YncE
VYVVDYSRHRVQKFDANGTFIMSWGTFGSAEGAFDRPYGIALDTDSNAYVTDTINRRVQKFAIDGTFLHAWGTERSQSEEFDLPAGIATDHAANVYVTNELHHIQKFDPIGTLLGTWGGVGSGSGPGVFYYPLGIAIGDERAYVADMLNKRIQKLDLDGGFVTEWYGFMSPVAVAVDIFGRVFVADGERDRIDVFDTSGAPLGSFGRTGGGPGEFFAPKGVATDVSGNVYVTEGGNNRVQKFACNVENEG